MRRPLISDSSPLPLKVATFTLLLPVLLAFIVVKVVTLPFERPMRRSADEVLRYLVDFLDGTGGPWDWDDFISIPIADPRLEHLRARAAALDLPMADTETAPLKALVAEAAALAAETHAAA
jgi:hypothetical protein